MWMHRQPAQILLFTCTTQPPEPWQRCTGTHLCMPKFHSDSAHLKSWRVMPSDIQRQIAGRKPCDCAATAALFPQQPLVYTRNKHHAPALYLLKDLVYGQGLKSNSGDSCCFTRCKACASCCGCPASTNSKCTQFWLNALACWQQLSSEALSSKTSAPAGGAARKHVQLSLTLPPAATRNTSVSGQLHRSSHSCA